MSNPTDPRQEYASTYFVQDRSNEDEFTRLHIQDHMVTAGMGGVLPEQPDPTVFRRVLDVGCGTGGWLLEAAKTYSTLSQLVGVDVNKRMVEYARAQTEIQQESHRVEFHTMDALLILEFPSGHFDLVNQRLGISYLRTWDWPKLLSEYKRVLRPHGVIRITEAHFNVESRSPALNRLNQMCLEAFHQAGHLFTLDKTGVTSQLAPLLRQQGLQNVQTRDHLLEYRTGTAEWQGLFEDAKLAYRTMVPFLRKWIRLPEDYETIYQQALSEMQLPEFVTTWNLLTAWGTVR